MGNQLNPIKSISGSYRAKICNVLVCVGVPQGVQPGPTFIKPDQLDPWIEDQLGNALLSKILPLQLWNFVSCPTWHKCGNCRGEIADRRVIFNWSLIHGSSWSGLIKVGPGVNPSSGSLRHMPHQDLCPTNALETTQSTPGLAWA